MRSVWLHSLAMLSCGAPWLVAADPVELPPVEITVVAPPAVVVAPNTLPPAATSVSISAKVPAELPPPSACGPCNQFLPAPCDVCERRPRTWAELGFVAWVLPDSDIAVPIFTRGPVGPGAGYIGQPGTTVIPGSDSLEPSVAIGFRMAAGGWFDDRQNRGVEVGGFVLERVAGSFSAGTGPNDTQGIYRPFRVDVGRGPLESAVTITNPPGLVGTVGAQSTMQLWGLDGGLVFNHCDSFPCRFDSILGLRYADLTESLSISTAAGNVQTVDDFSARTQFYGPQIGGRISCDRGRLGLSSSLKVGLGISHETLSVSGQTTIGGVTNGSGFLANAGNSGRYVRDRFAALPEWGFRINYRMSEMTYASVGYDLLYLSDALRPGDQLQRDFRVTNTGMMVGSAPPLASTDFFAHGLTLALGLKY